MKPNRFPILALAVLAALAVSSCGGQSGPASNPHEPYEYTHTTEVEQVVLYENQRIETAERSTVVTLEDLGYPELVVTESDEAENPSLKFTLPADASQGPDSWYILHLHCLIEFDESTGGGFGSVGVSTNDFGGASVHFDTQRVGDSPLVSLLGRECTSTRIDVHYYTYTTIMGVKPGTNTMTFGFDETNGAKINSVTFFGDTGIEVTATPPSEFDERTILPPEKRALAEEIALADAAVGKIVAGKPYAVRVTWADGGLAVIKEEVVEVEPAVREAEVRFIFEEAQTVEDVEAAALAVYVDLDAHEVTGVFPLSSAGMPELTQSRMEEALSTALGDAFVADLLGESGYALEQAGICQGGPVGRVGAALVFAFEPCLEFEGDFPFFPEEDVHHLEGCIERLEVFVNFEEEKVVQMYPDTVPEVGP